MSATKKMRIGLLLCGVAAAAAFYMHDPAPPVMGDEAMLSRMESAAGEQVFPPGRRTVSGDFLASYHAQAQYDWPSAKVYLERVLADDPTNPELLKRSMVLAMGSGDIATAAARARVLIASGSDEGVKPLATLILYVEQMSQGRIDEALQGIETMPSGDMTDFIRPVLRGWSLAGQGKVVIDDFPDTTIHLYHGALIALMHNDKAKTRTLTDKINSIQGLGTIEIERLADLYAALGDKDKALPLYEKLAAEDHNESLEARIKAVREQSPDLPSLLKPLSIKTAQQGAALALFDMAHILYGEQTDSSSKLFAQMALALDPDLIEARLLLGDTLARNGRLQEAINFFREVPENHKSYLAAQRYAADLLAEAGQREEAKTILNDLFIKHNDIESLIRIGDLYRTDEKFGNALEYYNQAAGKIGVTIPEEYWHLLYARGMAYEREGQWSKAEADLKAALTFRPDHPYLLNYLGYGWADQGINLDKSLELIERAVSLRPSDGYITDSLGWVLYMMGRYKDAVAPLERAVELLPYDPVINDHLGDVYWRVGRKIEAKYQWQRALIYAEDEKLKTSVNDKLENGLPDAKTVHVGTDANKATP